MRECAQMGYFSESAQLPHVTVGMAFNNLLKPSRIRILTCYASAPLQLKFNFLYQIYLYYHYYIRNQVIYSFRFSQPTPGLYNKLG